MNPLNPVVHVSPRRVLLQLAVRGRAELLRVRERLPDAALSWHNQRDRGAELALITCPTQKRPLWLASAGAVSKSRPHSRQL